MSLAERNKRIGWDAASAAIGAMFGLALCAGTVLGQGIDPSAPGPVPCSPVLTPGQSNKVPPGTTLPPEGAQASANLSEHLARSDGVICPPSGVDPEIRLPTPDAGRTPVIPPPGSPGGDPNVRPK